ncbi:PDZ domain-containing protein [Nocardioides albidus]|uniref:PDZ domain-containing protein n=1 Tax=Nocardioides albidus TaxID=1517589 RepID=A0A5C4VNZ5_9ACTN|nr:trypsin-like peptidase domain-containing protein [Nocardioides albidus]TNM37594.1 PDZ domain-containing protein [Nocardioides albidus]
MTDAHDPDHEPTEQAAPEVPSSEPAPEPVHPQWAPPPPDAAPLSDAAPEPTTPLPGLAPSPLSPPAAGPVPVVPPPADLAVRRPAPKSEPGTGRLAGWVLPVVAAVALVVGMGGGLLGALAYDRLSDDSPAGPGYSGDGLAGVDLEDQAPLAAPGSVAEVAQAVLPSTVQIIAEYGGEAAGASGSGWVLDGDGHIVTNNHVVAEAAKDNGPIVVVDHDRNRYDAEVVGRSPIYDLAVLYVKKHDKLKPAKMGSATRLQVGEPVVAIGSPLSLPDTVTSGIVSYLHRPVRTGADGSESWIDAIQTDAAINPGNSGGPLVNQKGEVIGVNSAIATAGGGSVDSEAGNIGVGFAIPVEQVQVTADQILKTGKAQYPVIGANLVVDLSHSGDGATIESIEPDSPAEDAGLKARDTVVKIEGNRVSDELSLIVSIRTHRPGDRIELEIIRDGKSISVALILAAKTG